jgi:hypothetical protein
MPETQSWKAVLTVVGAVYDGVNLLEAYRHDGSISYRARSDSGALLCLTRRQVHRMLCLSALAGRIILVSISALLSPVQEGSIWRVKIGWPNGAVHHFGKFTSEQDAIAIGSMLILG